MDHLFTLQHRIATRFDSDRDPSDIDRLCVTQVRDQFHLDFFGDPAGETFADLMEVLSDPDVAKSVVSLHLRGPDEGANGTRNWDLSPIAEGVT